MCQDLVGEDVEKAFSNAGVWWYGNSMKADESTFATCRGWKETCIVFGPLKLVKSQRSALSMHILNYLPSNSGVRILLY